MVHEAEGEVTQHEAVVTGASHHKEEVAALVQTPKTLAVEDVATAVVGAVTGAVGEVTAVEEHRLGN